MLKKIFNQLSPKSTPIRKHCIAISDVGKKRKFNEDSVLIDEKLGLYIVADGMGGHKAGEVASQLAIKSILNYVKKHSKKDKQDKNTSDTINKILQNAINEANHQINCQNMAQDISEGQGMGTTITGFWYPPSGNKKDKQIYAFNVGDSRCYSFYHGELQQLSTDHSHYQLWIETGRVDEIPRKNIIYKAIGPWKEVVADQYRHTIRKNELILLCSDGLNDMLADNDICAILNNNNNISLKETAQSLISAANNAGGKDNISVLLFKL